MKRITMIDKLTLYIHNNEYKIEIDEKFSKVANLDELEDLEQSVPGFFDVESISRQNNKMYLSYEIPEGYEPFEKAKNLVPIIKLQLIKNLLDIDPLLESDNKTFLDLNNVFYREYTDVKVLYRSNGLIPYHKDMSALDQYKLLIFGLISNKFSYKKFLVNKDNHLRSENNEFLFQVNGAFSFVELKALVDKELEKEQSAIYEKQQFKETSKKKGFKRKIYAACGSLVVLGLLLVGGYKQIEKNVKQEYKNEFALAEIDNEITLAMTSGDAKKAIKLMEDKGEDPAAIADMLVKAGKYNEAISYDPKTEKKVVAKLYETGQKEKVLDLEAASPFLTVEKQIVKEGPGSVKTRELKDKETLFRLALIFVENKNFLKAKDTFIRMKSGYESNEFSFNDKEMKQIDQYITKSKLEIKVKDLNSQILETKEKARLGEDQDIQNAADLQALEDALIKSQKELIQIDEELGIGA